LDDEDDVADVNEKLREREDYYNFHRTHAALDGQTPYEWHLAKSAASVTCVLRSYSGGFSEQCMRDVENTGNA
jgi:hypothetical protein